MKKRILLVIALSIPLLGFWGKSKARIGQPPVIIDSFAPTAIQPGVTWKVFLHANDKDGDMKDITAMLVEPGNVISPISFTGIKEVKDRSEFAGYMYLHTPTKSSFLGKTFLIKVQVRDRGLNRSEAVKFPLTFTNVPKAKIPEKWQAAAEHLLGGIEIDLEELDDWRTVY